MPKNPYSCQFLRYSTLPDGTEIPVQLVDGSIRTVGEKCGNLVTLAIENWTSEKIITFVLFEARISRNFLTKLNTLFRNRK